MALKPVTRRRHDALARTDWADVERALARHYWQAGYRVDHCGTGAGGARYDGGVDLRLRRDDDVILVQCKHWNARQVPHNDVHQLIGLMVNEGATGAILVTSGEFTRAAIEAATRHGHVQLIDGDGLRAMLGPLPEPKEMPRFWETETDVADARHYARNAALYVGERLLDAAEDRIRGGGRGSRRSTEVRMKGFIARALITVMGSAVVYLAFMGWVKHTFRAEHFLPAASQPRPVATQPTQAHAPVRFDAPGEGSPFANTQRALTEEEIREQQRKAEEAIKVLEATTPELYEGRPGQVRGSSADPFPQHDQRVEANVVRDDFLRVQHGPAFYRFSVTTTLARFRRTDTRCRVCDVRRHRLQART